MLVKSYIRIVILNRINTNDILQIQRPKTTLSPYICVMCMHSAETGANLFLHCQVVDFSWNELFRIFREKLLVDLETYPIQFKGSGHTKDRKILWQYAMQKLGMYD